MGVVLLDVPKNQNQQIQNAVDQCLLLHCLWVISKKHMQRYEATLRTALLNQTLLVYSVAPADFGIAVIFTGQAIGN